jgi:hypothetical protein
MAVLTLGLRPSKIGYRAPQKLSKSPIDTPFELPPKYIGICHHCWFSVEISPSFRVRCRGNMNRSGYVF